MKACYEIRIEECLSNTTEFARMCRVVCEEIRNQTKAR